MQVLDFHREITRILIATGLLLLVSCGGGRGSVTSSELVANGSRPLSGQLEATASRSSIAEIDIAGLVAQISSCTAPAGIDSELYAELTAELVRVLEERGTERIIASLPDPEKSKVTDLAISGDTSLATFSWSYANPADYDQNGEVNIADLTPVGVHFGKDSSASDWATASIADGDGNGLVNLADITPIGQNYLNRINGFELQLGDSSDASEWTLAADVAVSEGTVSSGRRSFSYELASASEGWYRAVPYENGNPRSLGEPGNTVQLAGSDPSPSGYSEPGGPGNSGTTPFSGPASEPDSVETRTFGQEYEAPFVGLDQNVYTVTSQAEAVSFDPDGQLRWSAELSDLATDYRLNSNDELLVGCNDGMLFHFDSMGQLQVAFDTGLLPAAPEICPDGSYLCIDSTERKLHAFDSDGMHKWSYPQGARVARDVFCSANGNIYVAISDPAGQPDPDPASLACLDGNGVELWIRDGAGDSTLTQVRPGLDNKVLFTEFFYVYCYSPEGELLWTQDKPIRSWAVGNDGTVAIGGGFNSTDSYYLVSPDGDDLATVTSPGDVEDIVLGQDGRVFWYDVFEGLKSNPGNAGGSYWNDHGSRVYGNGDASGNLYQGLSILRKIDKEGQIIWERGEVAEISMPPVFTADSGYYLNYGGGIGRFSSGGGQLWASGSGEMLTEGSPVIRLDSSVVYSAGRNYVEDATNKVEGVVRALDSGGNQLWEHNEPGLIPRQPRAGSDGSICFLARDSISSTFVMLNADGSERWRRDLEADFAKYPEWTLLHAQPQDKVYVAYQTGGKLLLSCWNADNTEVFSHELISESAEDNKVRQVLAAADGSCLGVFNEDLLRLDADGNVLWQQPDPGGTDFNDVWLGAALLADGSIIASFHYQLRKLDSDGNEVWTSSISQGEANEFFSRMLVDSEGRIYGSTGQAVRCFDGDGSLLWSHLVPGSQLYTQAAPVLSPAGTLFAVLKDARLLRVD
ncbi:PQQ-binding-like beta-propeller repeat protein [bacterium]|nr:PQQ-binding-like beta-propeller repeat protein [bacterium]